MVKNIMGLAPGVITTLSAVTEMPRVSDTSWAMRSRTSISPGVGP